MFSTLLALTALLSTPAEAAIRGSVITRGTTTTTLGTYPGPSAPTSLAITTRDHDSATLRWYNPTAASTATIERWTGGSWTAVRTVGAQTAGTATTSVDVPAVTDLRNCFRVRVADSVGSATSSQICFHTLDARYAALQRIELELTTTGSSYGAALGVHLQSPFSVDQYMITRNHTWVVRDLSGGGTLDRFDLGVAGVTNPSAITELRVTPESSSSTCVSRVGLRIDDVVVYERSYTTCLNVNSAQPLVITHAELRSARTWAGAGGTGIDPLTFNELLGAIDAEVGDILHETSGIDSAWWRGYPSYGQVDDSRITVSLPIDTYFGGLDATFDLVLLNECDPWTGDTVVTLYNENIDVDAASWWNLAAWFAAWLAEDQITDVNMRVADLTGCDLELYFAAGLGIYPRTL